jgi:inosose dehydratase
MLSPDPHKRPLTTSGVDSFMRIANAPCSWGVLEFEENAQQSPGFATVLDEIAGTGYAGTELGDWGFMPTEPRSLQAELDRRRLEMLGAFVPVKLADERAHGPGLETAVRTARLLAASGGSAALIVLADDSGTDPNRIARAGRIVKQDSLSPAQWTTFAKGAEAVAAAVRDETGLRTVFHPHCAGFVETPWEIDELMRRTDPALLGLCYDTGHISFGGGDPLQLLRKYLPRIWHVHFKDFSPDAFARMRAESLDYSGAIRLGIFCELGKGNVDFRAVLEQLRHVDYDGWIVVEQDVLPGMGTPADSARRNRDYLRRLGV